MRTNIAWPTKSVLPSIRYLWY